MKILSYYLFVVLTSGLIGIVGLSVLRNKERTTPNCDSTIPSSVCFQDCVPKGGGATISVGDTQTICRCNGTKIWTLNYEKQE